MDLRVVHVSTLLVFISIHNLKMSVDALCATRRGGCCLGRDDSCYSNSGCYCDTFCVRFLGSPNNDCCVDFTTFCFGPGRPRTPPGVNDACVNNRCSKATCINLIDDYYCFCNPGYAGTYCDRELGPSVRCSKIGDVMIMDIRAENNVDHQQIITAKATTDLTTSKCKTSAVTTTKNFLELTIKVRISDREQTFPEKASSDCFVQKDGSVTTKVSVLVVGQADARYIKGHDKYYKAVCDAANANGEVIALNNVGITSAINPTEKTSEVDGVSLELVKADDNTALGTSVSLAEEVKLKVTLTRKALVTAPLGVFLHDLHVSDQSDLSATNVKKLKMLNEYGCVEGIAAFKLENTFVTVDRNIVATSATKFEALTGKFSIVLFEGMSELKLFFTVEYEASCFVSTEDKCFNLAKYCKANTPSDTRRRRRSADGVRNGTVTLGVRIHLGGPGSTHQDAIGSDLQTKDECKTLRYFWIAPVVLGCLTLAAILFAFFLFRRLKLERRRSNKLNENLGVRNPAF